MKYKEPVAKQSYIIPEGIDIENIIPTICKSGACRSYNTTYLN